jgi:hypothetical protein
MIHTKKLTQLLTLLCITFLNATAQNDSKEWKDFSTTIESCHDIDAYCALAQKAQTKQLEAQAHAPLLSTLLRLHKEHLITRGTLLHELSNYYLEEEARSATALGKMRHHLDAFFFKNAAVSRQEKRAIIDAHLKKTCAALAHITNAHKALSKNQTHTDVVLQALEACYAALTLPLAASESSEGTLFDKAYYYAQKLKTLSYDFSAKAYAPSFLERNSGKFYSVGALGVASGLTLACMPHDTRQRFYNGARSAYDGCKQALGDGITSLKILCGFAPDNAQPYRLVEPHDIIPPQAIPHDILPDDALLERTQANFNRNAQVFRKTAWEMLRVQPQMPQTLAAIENVDAVTPEQWNEVRTYLARERAKLLNPAPAASASSLPETPTDTDGYLSGNDESLPAPAAPERTYYDELERMKALEAEYPHVKAAFFDAAHQTQNFNSHRSLADLLHAMNVANPEQQNHGWFGRQVAGFTGGTFEAFIRENKTPAGENPPSEHIQNFVNSFNAFAEHLTSRGEMTTHLANRYAQYASLLSADINLMAADAFDTASLSVSELRRILPRLINESNRIIEQARTEINTHARQGMQQANTIAHDAMEHARFAQHVAKAAVPVLTSMVMVGAISKIAHKAHSRYRHAAHSELMVALFNFKKLVLSCGNDEHALQGVVTLYGTLLGTYAQASSLSIPKQAAIRSVIELIEHKTLKEYQALSLIDSLQSMLNALH